MKTIYLIGGTMGVGKTTVSQQLKKVLPNSVFLDGDWCWDADPFQVIEEIKAMVMRNICFLLNSFLHCTAYKNIIFCWVMHEQSIIDEIIDRLDTGDARVIKISLMIDETNLRKRLSADIARGIRSNDVIDRSVARIDMYQTLDTIKVDKLPFFWHFLAGYFFPIFLWCAAMFFDSAPSSGRIAVFILLLHPTEYAPPAANLFCHGRLAAPVAPDLSIRLWIPESPIAGWEIHSERCIVRQEYLRRVC